MQPARAFVPWRVLSSLSFASFAFFAVATASAAPAGVSLNACGCYQDEAGVCFCEKKSKCGCEGECEPKGCEEKRTKERQKELDDEVKRAKARDSQSHAGAVSPEDGRSKRNAEQPLEEKRKEKPRRAEANAAEGEAPMCPPCPCLENKGKKTGTKPTR